MRILTSILLFLTGCAAVAYSYIGALVTLAGEAERSARDGDGAAAFKMIADFIMGGEIPQLTGFLYFGLLLVAISFVNLIGKRETNDR